MGMGMVSSRGVVDINIITYIVIVAQIGLK